MDHLYSTTTEHRKGQHLSFEHRVLIQTRLKDGWNPNKIAKEIGCAPNTVRNEIKRGTVVLYKGNILRYKATAGQATYEQNRQVCCRYYDFLEKVDFISFVEKKFFEDGWSLDALTTIRSQYSEHWDTIFKTITTDNGSEFSMLSELEDLSKTLVYFAHSYTSYEKGSVERHNGLIRRFIPNGKRIDSYSDEQISQIETWCNSLPRKLLGYRTPDDFFENELDRIYSCVA